MDPEFSFELRQIRREFVDAVDHLIKIIGDRDSITTEGDWSALNSVIEFYIARWPEDFKQFATSIPEIRESRNEGGYSESREIRYVGALPHKLERLIKLCFPYQEFNKDFIYKLIKRVRLFKVGGEGN